MRFIMILVSTFLSVFAAGFALNNWREFVWQADRLDKAVRLQQVSLYTPYAWQVFVDLVFALLLSLVFAWAIDLVWKCTAGWKKEPRQQGTPRVAHSVPLNSAGHK